MDLSEYQKTARSTAIYLQREDNTMLYPLMGLIGECGEVAEKAKKLIRDSDWEMDSKRKAAIAKELGDVMWYCANVCCDTNNDLQLSYQMRGHSIIQQICALPLFRLILHMNRHALEIATSLESWYYRDSRRISEGYKYREIPLHLSHVVACVEEIARYCDCTLEQIYTANIENLLGRKQRGTLHGDGDDR